MSIEYQAFFDVAFEVAKVAGSMILSAFNKTDTNIHYKNAVDLVTDTDLSVEKYVIGTLKSKFPDHLFVGEEVCLKK